MDKELENTANDFGVLNTPLSQYNTFLIAPTSGGRDCTQNRIAAMIDKRFSEEQALILRKAVGHLATKIGLCDRENFLRQTPVDFRSTSLWWPWVYKPDGSNTSREMSSIRAAFQRMLGRCFDVDGEDETSLSNLWEANHFYRGLQIGYFEQDRDSDGRFTAGLGTVNSYCDHSVISIAINSMVIGPDADISIRENIEYFGALIAHELLHNLGWRHLSGDRQKAVMYQFQSWVAGPELNLVDPSLPKSCAFE